MQKLKEIIFFTQAVQKLDSNLENMVTYQFGKQCFQFGIYEIALLAGLSLEGAASMNTVSEP